MPIFEYACNRCGRRFERLSREGESPACPSCASADLRKLLSAFAVPREPAGARPLPRASGPCGSCGDPRGPGACGLG